MRFNSTLGITRGVPFKDVVFTGYAADGGLLIPENIPTCTDTELSYWRTLSYVDVVKEVASKFISDEEIPKSDLHDIINKAFSNFSTIENILPLRFLQGNLAICEMFHGPTLAFKDYGMACLSQFINYFLTKDRKRTICVVATSGDTGGAALEAFKNHELVDIIVLMPKYGCSPIQELQMTTVGGSNTHVMKVEGSSDDLDVVMKSILQDKKLAEGVHLFSVNSINFGRILIQVAHHIYAYLQASSTAGNDVCIVVPSGALGNITSGCLAQKMGVPLKLVLCSNINDIAHKMLKTGALKVKSEVHQTVSNAMNIQNPYNITRLLWIFSNGDLERTRKLSLRFEELHALELPDDILTQMRQTIVDSQSTSDEVVLQTMHKCWEKFSYVVCPHTACGLAYCIDRPENNVVWVVLATASPAKFPEIVDRAKIPYQDLLCELKTKKESFEEWLKADDWPNLLRNKIRCILKMRI